MNWKILGKIKFVSVIVVLGFCAMVLPNSAWCSPTYYEMFVEKECSPDQDQALILPGIATCMVPEGALNRTTDIGMEVSFLWGAESPDVVLEFSPHGINFNTPITIRLSLLMMHFYYGDEIAIQYFNEDTGAWEWVDSLEINFWNRNYTIELDHFSIYAFVKIRSGN